MFKVIKKQTRSSVCIPFFFEINSNKEIISLHISENYYRKGKILGSDKKFSEDKRVVIITILYDSYDSYKHFISDKFLEEKLFSLNTIYDIENEITSDLKYIKE